MNLAPTLFSLLRYIFKTLYIFYKISLQKKTKKKNKTKINKKIELILLLLLLSLL